VVTVRRLSALAPSGNEDETLSTSARLVSFSFTILSSFLNVCSQIDGKRRYTAPTPSKVVKVHVKVGDRVTPGTPLFDLGINNNQNESHSPHQTNKRNRVDENANNAHIVGQRRCVAQRRHCWQCGDRRRAHCRDATRPSTIKLQSIACFTVDGVC